MKGPRATVRVFPGPTRQLSHPARELLDLALDSGHIKENKKQTKTHQAHLFRPQQDCWQPLDPTNAQKSARYPPSLGPLVDPVQRPPIHETHQKMGGLSTGLSKSRMLGLIGVPVFVLALRYWSLQAQESIRPKAQLDLHKRSHPKSNRKATSKCRKQHFERNSAEQAE